MIAQVAAVDLPILAQARPGSRVSFAAITHEEARNLYISQERNLRLLVQLIRRKMAEMEVIS
ncbi:hypothetical protein D3C75_1314100 [compost metagenome]